MEPQEQHPPVHPLLVILLGIFAVSTASIFIRFAQENTSSLVIAAYRLTLASIFLAPIALRRDGDVLRKLSRRQFTLGLLSGFLLALHFATWITSLEFTSVASSVVIVTTTPLWVALFSPLFLREPVTRWVTGGLLIALVGGIVIGLSDSCSFAPVSCPDLDGLLQGRAFLGNLLALAGALSGAGYFMIGCSLRARLSVTAYIFLVYGIAAVTLIGIMLGFGEKPWGFPGETYLWLVLLALVPQLIGHSSFNWALGYLPAAFVSITLLGEPIGTIILAYFLLDETPTPVKLIGAILILTGIAIANNQKRSKK
jgi:drug/metabolite transporter (DMT)-like permease